MPLVRIDLSSNALPKLRQIVSDVVYDAMTTVAKVPADDKFEIVTGHTAYELVYPKEGILESITPMASSSSRLRGTPGAAPR
jgi:4-oxalocrotonate tautomerase